MKNVSVMFLAVPASLKEELGDFSRSAFPHREYHEDDDCGHEHDHEHEHEEYGEPFLLDPSILLPVELPPNEYTLDPEKLSWETILSGMLRIISASSQKNLPEGPADFSRAKAIKNGDTIDLLNSGVPPEWTDYYRRFVLAVKPGIYQEFTSASIVKAKNGEFEMALEISAILEGLFPRSPGVLLNKALILEKRAAGLEKNGHNAALENKRALKAYEEALSAEPVLPDTYFNAGFFFMHLGEYKRAKEYFSLYVDSAEESGSPDEKARQAKKIIKNINDHGLDESSFMEAYDFIIRGNDEKGLVKIREFIEKHPKVWNGWFVLGWALRKLGRFGDGLEALKQARELGGDGSDLKNETAICLMETGDFEGARRELLRALRETSNDTKIISNLGMLEAKMGNREEARSYFRIVLELDPADKIAKQSLESLDP